MMTDDKPEKEKEATPKGAAEVDEKDLDQAAGGTETSIYFQKRQMEGTSRQDAAAAGPHVAPAKPS